LGVSASGAGAFFFLVIFKEKMMTAFVHLASVYVHDVVMALLKVHCPQLLYTDRDAHVNIAEYELLDFERIYALPTATMCNSYCIRKGLIRKAQFSVMVQQWVAKRPASILASAYPETWLFSLDAPDYLDEALVDECYQVGQELEKERGTVFILKPSLTAGGSGIVLFNTRDQLQDIVDGLFDEEIDGVQLREFVIQRYIDRPLLLQDDKRKFHLRVYVLCVGRLRVYVDRDILALFASQDYSLDDLGNTNVHLTNTCRQEDKRSLVRSFWELPGLSLDDLYAQAKEIIAQVFEAAMANPAWFQPLPNAFELYGFDLLPDQDGRLHVLEANAYPDFAQTGDELKDIVRHVFSDVVQGVVQPFVQALEAGEETWEEDVEKFTRLDKVFRWK
jgi:hypothetical protein